MTIRTAQARLSLHARRIVASYLRAIAGTASTVAVLDSLTELRGVLIAAATATVPAILRAVEALADDIEPA